MYYLFSRHPDLFVWCHHVQIERGILHGEPVCNGFAGGIMLDTHPDEIAVLQVPVIHEIEVLAGDHLKTEAVFVSLVSTAKADEHLTIHRGVGKHQHCEKPEGIVCIDRYRRTVRPFTPSLFYVRVGKLIRFFSPDG